MLILSNFIMVADVVCFCAGYLYRLLRDLVALVRGQPATV